MNNLERAQRDWETPPDEEEAVLCENCGQEMEKSRRSFGVRNEDAEFTCTNQYCPEKWTSEIVHDMANELVETKGKLEATQLSLRYVRNSLSYVEGIRQEREQTIETLEHVINKLTQSQSNEVLRDTEYQIKRMEDALANLWHEISIGQEEEMTSVTLEWNEVVKILRQL